jgi:hypothetical protein
MGFSYSLGQLRHVRKSAYEQKSQGLIEHATTPLAMLAI